MNPRLIFEHWKIQTISHLRAPTFLAPVFIYPWLFYLFFAQSDATTETPANRFLISYTLYAFMGAIFHQVTGSIAEDRRQAWAYYLLTLPRFRRHQFAGRLIAALVSASLAAGLVIALASILTPASMELEGWLYLLAAIAVGFVPLYALGATLGYWLNPRSALTVALLIFFSLAFTGALWMHPSDLPGWIDQFSPYTPTRMWAELAWSAALDQSWSFWNWGGLVVYTAIFSTTAFLGAKRYNVRAR